MKQDDSLASCPYCNSAVATKEHEWWHCSALGRPPDVTPLSEAQRLLGWPTGTNRLHDQKVLDFLTAVRVKDLQLRYG